MILGFTSTRKGLVLAQHHQLMESCYDYLGNMNAVALHGGAYGGDEVFDGYACVYADIEVYPCSSDRYNDWLQRKNKPTRKAHDIIKPLVRNRIIVDRCDRLIACPAEPEEQQRGGTWSTYRYARKINKPITLILPDGTVKEY